MRQAESTITSTHRPNYTFLKRRRKRQNCDIRVMKGKRSLMRKRDAGGRGSERQRERERVDFHAGSMTDKKEHGSRTMKDS